MPEQEYEPCDITVVAYITTWCPDCTRSRRILQRFGIAFVEIDIEKVSGAEDAMRAVNGGSGKVPTILIDSREDRIILVEPSDRELSEAIRNIGVNPTGT